MVCLIPHTKTDVHSARPNGAALTTPPILPQSTPKIGLSCLLLPDLLDGVLRCFDPAAFWFWRPGIALIC